jgi:hypothetical protein
MIVLQNRAADGELSGEIMVPVSAAAMIPCRQDCVLCERAMSLLVVALRAPI